MRKIVVLADTHLRGGLDDRLPPPVRRAIDQADLCLHAGDVTSLAALHELESLCPTICVLGNNDTELVGHLPEQRVVEIEGVEIGMIHDSGPTPRRPAALSSRFPEAALVVYGHSHVPDDSIGLNGQRLFNPGSPTQRRAQPKASYGRLLFDDGAIAEHEIVFL